MIVRLKADAARSMRLKTLMPLLCAVDASWILLPHLADWRWMEASERTPWYPTARLFRQRVAGDWAEVVERVSDAASQGSWRG